MNKLSKMHKNTDTFPKLKQASELDVNSFCFFFTKGRVTEVDHTRNHFLLQKTITSANKLFRNQNCEALQEESITM